MAPSIVRRTGEPKGPFPYGSVAEREHRPFRNVRDSRPCYLLTLDPLPEGKDGARHLSLMETMALGDDLE